VLRTTVVQLLHLIADLHSKVVQELMVHCDIRTKWSECSNDMLAMHGAVAEAIDKVLSAVGS
jgi:hypothetical protein